MKNLTCLKEIFAILAFGCQLLFAQVFYFLPPDNDNWIAGNSYFYNGDTEKAELMQIDATRCGWFKKEFRSVSEIPEKALVFLGSQGRDKLDTNGINADLSNPAWIPLREKFGASSTLYLIAENLRFTNISPGNLGEEQAGRCSYKMAAFIYDTDNSVNPSFSGIYCSLDSTSSPSNPPGQANSRCTTLPDKSPSQGGLRRGIVKPDLDTTTRKPTFAAKNGYANWVDAESFNAAFTPYGEYKGEVTNVPRCYDMPFSRVENGTWEFDSDKMLTPNGRDTVYGFYPYILDPAYISGPNYDPATEGDYSRCPTCGAKYKADCSTAMDSTKLNNPALTFDYNGKTYTGLEAFNRANSRLLDGWNTRADDAPYNPYRDWSNNNSHFSCSIRNANNTYTYLGPRPGPSGTQKDTANLSFCFESHAQFTYENGQEFFFRGDDDIWVFINDKLVIDLGGIHSAAPAFVDLDSISNPRLVEGEKYNIDIFFCERMGTQSNVRVSTNMYITQKSTFENRPDKNDQWLCAYIIKGNDCASKMDGSILHRCGYDLLRESEYTVDFYMIMRGTEGDTTWLSGTKNRSDCVGDANKFTCLKKDGFENGGIKVDSAVYSCGGSSKCQGRPKAIETLKISGTWTVYARLMDANGQQVPGTKAISIDNIKTTTNARIVWGNLISEDKKENKILRNAYGDITKIEQSIIAGKRTPIYVAGGHWENADNNYTTFIYDNDSATVVAVKYSLSGTMGLDITLDSLGEKKAVFPRNIPPSGIDTLWVKGDFYMGEKEFDINLDGVSNSEDTPSLKLTVYQPKLIFTTSDTTLTPVNPANPSLASGFLRWTGGDTLPPYVGKGLEVYIVAWDSLRKELCSHCSFILGETSSTNNSSINNKWPEVIVQSDAIRIENGRQTILIRGRDIVIGADFAKWRIYGPSNGLTFAEWDSLQFRDAPVPMPIKSEIYDRNGDGIGDSLRIAFGKSFKNDKGVIVDSLLPVLIEVIWEKGYAVPYHNPKHNVDSLKKKSYVMKFYNKDFFEENRKYWEQYLVGDTLMVIADSTTAFSKNILTSGYNSGKGNLLSYTPFYDQNRCVANKCDTTAFMWRPEGYEASIFDKIPPIVVRAEYERSANNKGNCEESTGCRETIVAYLSEPVFYGEDYFDELARNPFSYCLGRSQNSRGCPVMDIDSTLRHSQSWKENLGWAWELNLPRAEDQASSASYKPATKTVNKMAQPGSARGDSIVELTYLAKSIGSISTRMPKADDWIKIRPSSPGSDIFRDAEGNSPNPREIGVIIRGTNPSKQIPIRIAEVKPNDPPLNGIFEEGREPPWWSDAAKIGGKNLFPDGTVAELLPVPRIPIDYTDPDSIKKYYPGSVGTVFDVGQKMVSDVNTFLRDECSGCTTRGGLPLSENIAKAITVRANAYYHTNLGNYTAHSKDIKANCESPIFQNKEGRGNCYSNEFNFYLAWDLRANSGRYVGAGAYVGISKFHLQLDYRDSKGQDKTKKLSETELIEMFGVTRGK